MTRRLYSLLWWLALPAVPARLRWRGRTEAGFRPHWAERLGFYGPPPGHPDNTTVSAVSVGEKPAAEAPVRGDAG